MLRTNTAIECWEILNYEIKSIIEQCVPVKKKTKKTIYKETLVKIAYMQTMSMFYRRTRKDEDYTNIHNTN